jgi:hypothetical protein
MNGDTVYGFSKVLCEALAAAWVEGRVCGVFDNNDA